MNPVRLTSDPRADAEVEEAFDWYEGKRAGLGLEFLSELRATYDRIAAGPLKYQVLRGSVRRALLRRFPYAVYFALTDDATAKILAILRESRDPERWQRRQLPSSRKP